jgi:ABC-type Fe3+-hydroxamate transport system substrate-binding protein
MMAGGGTFINDMLRRCGMENIFGQEMRYPVATVEELRSRQCQLLILSSEPFPFDKEHKKELQACLPGTRIITADGTFFSWYGSRLLRAANYFAQLIDALRNAETAG